MQKGILYGVGVGPGDPQLLTLKAVAVIQTCGRIAVPGEHKEQTTAYQIVRQVLPEIETMPCLCIPMPMTKDRQKLASSHAEGARRLIQVLEQGDSVAFLTLGDPTIYSTYLYLHRRVCTAGYQAEIVSGVPSFCAAAARMGISLAEGAQMLHIIPSSYTAADGLELPGTKVFMKAGTKMEMVKEALALGSVGMELYMAQNCGMENEQIYSGMKDAAEIPDDAGYYSLIIVKEPKNQ